MKMTDELNISIGHLLDYIYFYCDEVLAENDPECDFSGNINRKDAICSLRKRIMYDLMSDDSDLRPYLYKQSDREIKDFVKENSVDKGFLQD